MSTNTRRSLFIKTGRTPSSQQSLRQSLDSEICNLASLVAAILDKGSSNNIDEFESSSSSPQRQQQQRPPSSDRDPGLLASLAARNAVEEMTSRSHIIDPDIETEVAPLRLDEIVYGRLLGRGGFSDVCQVTSIKLDPSNSSHSSLPRLPEQASQRSIYSIDEEEDTFFTDDNDKPITLASRRQQQHESQVRSFVAGTTGGQSRPRYAIKFLSQSTCTSSSGEYDDGGDAAGIHEMAAADMAREAKFLANLRHPSIIKLRGVCSEGVEGFRSNTYFLLLDLLGDTLSTRLRQWREELRAPWLGGRGGVKATLQRGRKQHRRKESFAARLKVAYDIAGALTYLHDRNIVFLDLKPDNLGFDCRGDIKIFDFGFAKELLPEDRCPDGRYEVNGAGSLRYMAPEVSLGEPFNLTADVYSFGVLLWEILALKLPYAKIRTPADHSELVVGKRYRPKVKSKGVEWTDQIQKLLNSSWSHDFRDRPFMNEVYNILKLEVCRARGTDKVPVDMNHNLRRSTHVFNRNGHNSLERFRKWSSRGSMIGHLHGLHGLRASGSTPTAA